MRSDVAVVEAAAVADAAADEDVTKSNPPNNTKLLMP
jgi:hypothetical protein